MELFWFGIGFVAGALMSVFVLDRYYKTYLKQIVNWIWEDVYGRRDDRNT